MENASKALLIAGGVLIAMIIASFGVYLYGVYRSHSESMLAAMSEKEFNEYNAKFLDYEDRELTANELVSILNLVRDSNIAKNSSIEISWGSFSGDSQSDAAYNTLKNTNIYTISEEAFTTNCNAFVNCFSKIAKIKKTKSDGSEEFLYTNLYYFSCKIQEYDNDTGLVKKIHINAVKNEEVV